MSIDRAVPFIIYKPSSIKKLVVGYEKKIITPRDDITSVPNIESNIIYICLSPEDCDVNKSYYKTKVLSLSTFL